MNTRLPPLLPIAFALCALSLPAQTHAGPTASTEVIVISGQAAPDDNGTFDSYFNPVTGDAGQVAFHAFFAGTTGGDSDQSGIMYRAAGGELIQLARAGQPATGGGDEVFAFNRVLANGAGEVAFFTFYNDAGGAFTGDAGILAYDPVGGITELARIGLPSPSGKGDLSVFGSGVSLNNSGEFGFIATFTHPGTMVNNTGAFTADGVRPLVELSPTKSAG